MPYVLRRDMLRVRDSNGEYIELDTMKGDTGETGQKGETGETGATPHFIVGTVSTGAPGTPASVSITGTDENPVLNMSIPKGDTGETGQKGETGETGATPHFTIGTVTTGLPGTDASAEITGTDEEPVLNMTIPRGNPGEVTEEDLSVVEEGLSHKADSIRDEATGDIVSINSELTATLEEASFEFHPVQDLHGQEYPYPAGGGKNLAPTVVGGQANGVTCTVNSDGSVNLNGTATGNARFVSEEFTLKAGTYKSNGIPQGGLNNYVFYLDGVSGSANVGGEITITVSSDVVTKSVVQVYNGGTANNITMYPMIRLSSIADATYAPYSNICPITGYDGLNAYRTGHNVWDEEWELGQFNNVTGQPISANDCIRSKNFIPVLPSSTYYTTYGNGYMQVFFYGVDESFISQTWIGTNNLIITPSGCYKMKFRNASAYGTTYNHDISINYPATDTDYHAYTGDTATYTFPQTVYDGVLTINEYGSGQIVSKYASVDMSKLSWSKNWSGDVPSYIFYSSVIGNAKAHATSLCECYKTEDTPNPATLTDKSEVVHTNKRCYVKDSSFTTADALRSFLSGQHLVYELVEPVIIPLSKQEVLSLIEGQNYIWHDANGNTTVIYRVDTKQYIDAVKEELDSAEADLAELTETVGEIEGDVSDLQNEVAHKEDWTVGNAEQLLSDNYTEDSEPYVFRKSVSGDREFDEIVGGTIAWNQLINKNNFPASTTSSGITFTNNNDGSITAAGTSTGFAFLNRTVMLPTQNNPTHKFYLCGCPAGGSMATYAMYSGYDLSLLRDDGNGAIFMGSEWRNQQLYIVATFSANTEATVNLTFKPQLFDLTQMFGSPVADYIYNLEHTTAGAGVALFRSLFPKPYYEYNAGELKSITGLVSHDTVGFNQWDEEWEYGNINDADGQNSGTSTSFWRAKNYIPVFPGETYYQNTDGYLGNFRHYFYDADKNWLDTVPPKAISQNGGTGVLFTIPSKARYMRFRFSVDDHAYPNQCLNISWDGKRDGEYESYEEWEYPLDSSLELRGIPKLDTDNKLYYDGDTYESDGTVTRRYGIVDLGTLNFAYNPGHVYFATSSISDRKVGSLNIFTERYVTGTRTGQAYIQDKMITSASATAQIVIKDSAYTDVATFKTAMSGVYLVYELATPTTETAEPFQSPQICSEYGTEEYVYDSEAFPVPVGHVTKYPDNLRKKLDGLPWDLSMMAPIETGTTASQAYAAGKYFLLNNQFCKAKTSIASGATFTLNTNYEVTTLADELFTAINS